MSQPIDENYPKEKPEHSVEISEPMTYMRLNVRTGEIEAEFGPGEIVKIDVITRIPNGGLSGAVLVESLARHIADELLAWAPPEVVKAELERQKIDAADRIPGVPTPHDGAPF